MTKSKIITTIGGTLAIAALIVGCTTTGSNTNNSALEDFAITSLTAVGTSELVSQSDGAQYRPELVIAQSLLEGFSTGTNILTTAQVSAELTQAGVSNNVVAPIIVNGLTLADQYSASGTNASFQEITGDIANGIGEGLQSTPAAIKAKYHKN